jgi:hypothetical protein
MVSAASRAGTSPHVLRTHLLYTAAPWRAGETVRTIGGMKIFVEGDDIGAIRATEQLSFHPSTDCGPIELLEDDATVASKTR